MRGIPNNAVECSGCGSRRGSPKDALCLRCRNRRNLTVYHFTPGQDALLREAYASRNRHALSAKLKAFMQLTHVPASSMHRRAKQLGLRFEVVQRWTPEEIHILEEMAGEVPAYAIARRLRRSTDSVMNKLERLGFSARVQLDGFTQEELAGLLGVSDITLRRWMARGWLLKYGGCITEEAVRGFLLEHLAELNLARVDQDWIKGLLAEMLRQPAAAKMEPEPQRVGIAAVATPAARPVVSPVVSPVVIVAPAQAILEAVAREFAVPQADILSPIRERSVVLARNVVASLLREHLQWGFARIGRRLQRDHTTVLAGLRVLDTRLAADPQLDARYRRLLEQLRAPEEIAA